MQKMITVTIDTKMLADHSHETFSINEVENVNEIMEAGWNMEEWEFLNEEPDEDGKITIIAILNDDNMTGMDEEMDFEDAEELEELSEEDKEH